MTICSGEKLLNTFSEGDAKIWVWAGDRRVCIIWRSMWDTNYVKQTYGFHDFSVLKLEIRACCVSSNWDTLSNFGIGWLHQGELFDIVSSK